MNYKCTKCSHANAYYHPATQTQPEESGFECVHHDKAYCLELLEENCWDEETARNCQYFNPDRNKNIDYCWEDSDGYVGDFVRRSLDE